MKLWQALYGMIWLNFFVLFIAVFDPIPYKGYVHGGLGLLVIALAYRNGRALAATSCPPRLKRIAQASFNISLLAAVTGITLAIPAVSDIGILYYAIKALHLLAIAAILTQTASVATAHDVWEQREYAPGEPAAGTGGEKS